MGRVDGVEVVVAFAVQVEDGPHAVEVGADKESIDRIEAREGGILRQDGGFHVDLDEIVAGLAVDSGHSGNGVDADGIVPLAGGIVAVTGIDLGRTGMGAGDVEDIGPGTQPEDEVLQILVINADRDVQTADRAVGQAAAAWRDNYRAGPVRNR